MDGAPNVSDAAKLTPPAPLTPMMAQYQALRAEAGEALLF